MNDDRQHVFQNIRDALEPLAARVPLPDWEPAAIVCKSPRAFASLTEHFGFKFEAAGGLVIEGFPALQSWLKEQGVTTGYVDAQFAAEFAGSSLRVDDLFDRSSVDEYQFGVTAAFACVAETGSIVLSESTTSSRMGALAPWIHIAVVRRDRILPDMPSAIAQFGEDRAVAFVTGPSKTADVEGILIKGVHGPGVQVCCLV